MLVLGDLSPPRLTHWRNQIVSTNTAPKLVLEFWEPFWIMKDIGPMAKLGVTQWSDLGYESTCQTLNGLQVGGVVDRAWLVVVRANTLLWGLWAWPDFPEVVVGPMSKCLWPTGIPRSAYHCSPTPSRRGAPQ
jgi:hypothetical protein